MHHGLPDVSLRADPPDLPAGAGGDHGWGQRAVEGGVPLGGDLGHTGCQIVEAGQHLFAGAIRAAAALARPAGDPALVLVTEGTDPPDLPIGIGGDLLGRQAAILGGVPLGGNLREGGGQVVFAGLYLPAGTVGALGSAQSPGGDGCLPAVPFFTLPPDSARRAGQHIPGRQGAVLGGVPLGCHHGVHRGQVGLSRLHRLVGTQRAAAAADAGLDLCHPLVPVGAAPPDVQIAAGEYLLGCQAAVFGRVPFSSQIWENRTKICFTWDGQPPGTVWAAGLTTGAGIGWCLPAVPPAAAPPNLPLAAVGDRLRCQRSVSLLLPLAQQLPTTRFQAKSCERFAHGIPPIWTESGFCLQNNVQKNTHMLFFYIF